MKLLKQSKLDEVFQQGSANLTVHRRSDREWYFSFTLTKYGSDSPGLEHFTLETQRGKLRTWADPRVLFEFLQNRGITSGTFNLKEGPGSHENSCSEGESNAEGDYRQGT